jgi:hypothetical protein
MFAHGMMVGGQKGGIWQYNNSFFKRIAGEEVRLEEDAEKRKANEILDAPLSVVSLAV